MQSMMLNGSQSRYGVLADLVSRVVCGAPLSPSTAKPAANASLVQADRGWHLTVRTLSDDSSVRLEMPHTSKDVAHSCLDYVRQRLANRGFSDEALSA
jgi:hypothetical protein